MRYDDRDCEYCPDCTCGHSKCKHQYNLHACYREGCECGQFAYADKEDERL